MNVPGNMIRLSAAMLVLLVLCLPRTAMAQHSAAAAVNVAFAVLPVHTGAIGAADSYVTPVKVTVSVEAPRAGMNSPATKAGPHMLVTSDTPLARPPRGSCLLVTVTE
jgi:hypothetical protein